MRQDVAKLGASMNTLRMAVVVLSFGVAEAALAIPIHADGFETPCSTDDADGDRLDGCQEAFHKTDPNNDDTDEDGLIDGDEVLGTAGGLQLPALGAHPRRKDVLIEYDWFIDDAEQGTNDLCPMGSHSHRPEKASLDIVTAMFASAPVANPDGSSGIHVIHDYGQGGLFTGGSVVPDPSGEGLVPGTVKSEAFDSYYASEFAANRKGYFHYVLLPHRFKAADGQTDFSGIADISHLVMRDEMIVSLYCARTVTNVAHAIVHELGHNFALRHGGYTHCNDKPNYNSIMNYRYTFSGVDQDCNGLGDGLPDYSSGTLSPLDENDLDEYAGLCNSVSIDWNKSGLIEKNVVHDFNPVSGQGFCTGLTVLLDHDDWGGLLLDMTLDGDETGPVPDEELIDCPPAPLTN